ncbi:MAG: hypothetical protein ABJ327_13905 [Litoreibacter sp.]
MVEQETPLDTVIGALSDGAKFIWDNAFAPQGIVVFLVIVIGIWISIRYGSKD